MNDENLFDIANILTEKYKFSIKYRVFSCIERGDDVNAVDSNGNTIFDIARRRGAGWYFDKMVRSYELEKAKKIQQANERQELFLKSLKRREVECNTLNGLVEHIRFKIANCIFQKEDLNILYKASHWAMFNNSDVFLDIDSVSIMIKLMTFILIPSGKRIDRDIRKFFVQLEIENNRFRKRMKRMIRGESRNVQSYMYRVPTHLLTEIQSFLVLPIATTQEKKKKYFK